LSTDDGLATDDTLLPVRRPRRRSLPGEIVDQLLELIASSDQGASPRLPSERTLSLKLGVSRTSLREALSALSELGVVETRAKVKYGLPLRARAARSWRAAGNLPERELVNDPLEVRRMLEPAVAARAAERVTEEALDELKECLRLMEAAARRGELVIDHDSAFHVAIAKTTGNQTLVHLITSLTDVLRESRMRSFQPHEAIETAIADHRKIISAIRAGNVSAARDSMRQHLDHVESLIKSTLRDSA
jgi:GntR family transcriptional repressor for pyruvate dehydrogenase complex